MMMTDLLTILFWVCLSHWRGWRTLVLPFLLAAFQLETWYLVGAGLAHCYARLAYAAVYGVWCNWNLGVRTHREGNTPLVTIDFSVDGRTRLQVTLEDLRGRAQLERRSDGRRFLDGAPEFRVKSLYSKTHYRLVVAPPPAALF